MSAQHYSLWLLARRSLRQHSLSTLVTALSLALASGLVMAVLGISAQSRTAFTIESTPFDAVLGARGSQLQLVLNSVFHLETSPGNLPWSAYQDMQKRPGVRAAVPYAVGDSWRGFRVVGTNAQMFDAELLGPRTPRPAAGRVFDETLREAVIGSYVAARTGVRVGDEIHPEHGVDEGHEHDEDYVVVGVLAPTNTPLDRCVWIPIEGMFRMGGHVLRGAGEEYHPQHDEEIPDEVKEVSAVLLAFSSPQVGLELDREFNKSGKDATLAWPIARVMAELFDKLGWMDRVLTLVALLTMLVGAASIVASLYDAMHQRRREMAILRALGARRGQLSRVVVLEATTIAALGALGGFAVYFAILSIARGILREQTGIVLDLTALHASLAFVPIALVALGALCGAIPAWKAYRVEVAEDLGPTS
jgi:putative ABC transport system permease protein